MEAGKSTRRMKSLHSGKRDSSKNSKWLEENLKGMQEKVDIMKKLIEEDADSFAQRAEMYYQKRPQLMNLVDEFYRSYRVLAERYDQQQGSFEVIPPDVLAGCGISVDPSHISPNSHIHKLKTSLSVQATQKNDINISSSSSSDSDTEAPSPSVKPSYDRSISENHHHHHHHHRVKRGEGSSSSSSSSSVGKALQVENESLRIQLERGLSKQKDMEHRLVSLQEELKALASQNTQLSMEKRSSDSELVCLQEEVENLKRKNTELSVEGARQIRRWEEDIEELHRVRALLESSQGLSNALEQQLRKLQKELESAKSDAMEAMENLSERDKQVRGLEEEALRRESSIEALQKELECFHGERSRGIELSGMLHQQLSHLQQELLEARDESHRLSAELIDKTVAMEKLEVGIQKQEEIVADLRQVIAVMQEEEKILKNRLEERSNKAESLHLQVQNLEALLDDSRSVNYGLEEQWKALQRELQVAASDSKAAMESMICERDVMVKRLEEIVESREKTIQGLQKELESFRGERSRELELTDILEKQLVGLKQELATSIQQLKSYEESQKLEKTRLEEAISQLMKEKEELQTALDRCNEQAKDMDIKFASLSSQSIETGESLQFHQAELSRVQSELSERSEMVHKLEEEMESLLKTLQHLLHEENGSSHGSFQSRQLHASGHLHFHEPKHHKLRDLRDGLVHLITDRRQIKEEAITHGSIVKELQQQLISLKEELNIVKSASMNKDEENSDQRMRLKAMNEQVMELQEKVKDLEERLKEKDEEMNRALNSESEEMMFLTQELSKLQGLHGKLQKERSDLIHDRERSLLEHSLVRQALEEVEKDLAAENGRNSLLETQLKEARSRIQELEAMTAHLKAEKTAICAELSSSMDGLQRQNNDLLEQLQQKSRALEAMEKDLGAENCRSSQLESKLEEASNKIKELETRVSQLETEKKAVSIEIASVALLLSEEQRKSDDFEEELKNVRSDLSAEKEQLHEKDQEIEELSSKLSVLREEMMSMSIELAQKVNDYAELEAAMGALRSELALLLNQKETLSEELALGANTIRELQEAITRETRKLEEEEKKYKDMHDSKERELHQIKGVMENLDWSFKKLREQKISFGEAMTALPVENVHELQKQVNKLLEKIATAELAIASERRRGDERQSVMQQEIAFLREENQRQGFIIFDRCEEKRDAIRQLCIAIDYLQEKNKSLEGAIAIAREKIQQRSVITVRRRGWNFLF